MQLRENYDWVVLGDHPGALLGAALGARLGLSVLVLPLGSSMKCLISKEGNCLDPESNFLIGLSQTSEQQGLLAQCLTRLGILPADEANLGIHDGLPQILTLGSRLSLQLQNDALALEFDREFGQECLSTLGLLSALRAAEQGYYQYWRELLDRLSLPVNKMRARNLKELRRVLDRQAVDRSGPERAWLGSSKRISQMASVRENSDLTQIFYGLWYGIVSHPASDPLAADLLQLFALARTGGRFRGGLTAYRAFLLRLAKKFDADIPSKITCQRLMIENGRLVGIEVDGVKGSGSRVFAVRGGLLGCSLSQAHQKLSIKGKHWLKKLKRPPTPVGWRFTVALRVNAEAIPPGMSSRMIWKEAGAPALEIEMALPSEYGLPDAGSQKLIFLRTMLSYHQESLNSDYQRIVAGRMVRQIMEIIPFVEYHMISVFPDFRQTSASEEFSKVYDFKKLSDIPDNLYCYSGQNLGAVSGIEGLFLASDEAYPGLGSMGSVVAALESVAGLAHRSGLPGPFA